MLAPARQHPPRDVVILFGADALDVMAVKNHDLTGARVLIIESDQAIANLLMEALYDEGYQVTCVPTPREATVLFRARGSAAFDLVLSQPFTNSASEPFERLDGLRAMTTAPIVICSRHDPARFAGYRERGYAGYLAEPFDLQDLIALVASICHGAAAGEAEWATGARAWT